MIYYLKHIGSYLIISALTTITFILFLVLKRYPDGAVGMIPFLIALNCVIAFFLSSVLLLILKFKLELSLLKSSVLYTFIYWISLIFYIGANPFNQVDEISRNVDLWLFLSEIISVIIFNLGILIGKKFA